MFMLEELGVPYEVEIVDVRAGEGQRADYLCINPMGKVPAIKDEGAVVFEAGAICTYLADKYAAGRLAPSLDDPRRGAYLAWIFLGPSIDAVMVDLMQKRAPPPRGQAGYGDYRSIVRALETGLAHGGPWLLGDQFTAADVFTGGQIVWAFGVGVMEPNPLLSAYAERIRARPAFERARARDSG
jgi:glutathione S-transferase